MTKQQAQTTAEAPSVGSIVYTGVMASVVASLTVWLITGAETDREFVGAALCVIFTVSLLAQCAIGLIKRSEVAMVTRRRVLESALREQGYTPEDGVAWLERQPGSPTYKPGPY